MWFRYGCKSFPTVENLFYPEKCDDIFHIVFTAECDPTSDGEPSGWINNDVMGDVIDTGIDEVFLADHLTTYLPAFVSDKRWDPECCIQNRVEIRADEKERLEINLSGDKL